ncbi:unnamed protein product [Gulo gulo]|uniref:Uncharacterized protein n=1 Tax=Gulo gulo TaxID=48420 RepID=A0A9X9QA16_GULGU|nr:unnamed protein product [Gulo gulo]
MELKQKCFQVFSRKRPLGVPRLTHPSAEHNRDLEGDMNN